MHPAGGAEEDWRPSATMERLRERARMLSTIRRFFDHAGILEVETPACSAAATTDPALDSLSTRISESVGGPGRTHYLHTSPEFPMKRLLAAGSGPIYQICRVFRDGESGRYHNPEFTLLEWYRPGYDHHRLMDELASLVGQLLSRPPAEERISYRELFLRYLSVDPHRATATELREVAAGQGLDGVASLDLPDADAWRDLLLTHLIEPRLPRGLCFVYDFPESQASLARIRRDTPPVAERFELYVDGIEIANGFHELTDAREQEGRFLEELRCRERMGRSPVPLDRRLLNALESGVPSCAGVAVGIDRLLMVATGVRHINEVIAFPLDRA